MFLFFRYLLYVKLSVIQPIGCQGCFNKLLSLLYISFSLFLSGPHQSEMSGVDDKVVTVKKLFEGNYVFKLTVTDDKGLTGTDTVAVNVKKGV